MQEKAATLHVFRCGLFGGEKQKNVDAYLRVQTAAKKPSVWC